MPSYDFENKETGEVEEHIMKIAEYDQFLEDNPHLKRVYLTPLHIDHDGGKSVLSRAGDGWKEVQSRIKSGLPPRLRDNIKGK
jgi:hypothetical protein